MTYMIAAYLVIWVVTFVFVLSMVRRQVNLRKELATIKETAQQKGPK